MPTNIKPLSQADTELIFEIQRHFPTEAYRGGIPLKLDANIGPQRSKLCRLELASARGLLGDVLIDFLVGPEQFDDLMLIYYLEGGEKPGTSRDKAIQEFTCLTKRQRRVVASWLHHISSSALASEDAAAYGRAVKFWDGFAQGR